MSKLKAEDLLKYYEKTFHAALFISGNKEIAEDATQETFLKAYNKLMGLHDPNKIGPWLAVIACGVALGAGIGVALRSMGSTGGADILAVAVRERFGMPIGRFEFLFNLVVFALGLATMKIEAVLYSVAMNFLAGWVTDACLSMFSERRMAMVISARPDAVVQAVLHRLGRGATVLEARGGWSGEPKQVVLVMLNNLEVKRLEELVYEIDPGAFLIMGSGFNVLGQGFSGRKEY